MEIVLKELLTSSLCVLFSLALWPPQANAQSEATTTGTKCYKNEELGEYATNIYYCADTSKPECCEVEEEFTCCEKKTDRTLKHQFILWGAVFGVVGAVAIIWMCYRKDTYMCEGETLSNRMKRCCGCEKKIKPDDDVDLSDLSNEKGSVSSLEVTKTTGYYDEHVPVTARGVTPVVPRAHGEAATGNDSDSGRGSTMSVDGSGSGSAHKPRAGSSLGEGSSQDQGHDVKNSEPQADGSLNKQAEGTPTQKEKKKRKKNKKNKTKAPDGVIEEVEEIE